MPKHLVTDHNGGEMPTDPAAVQEMMQAFGAWASGVGSALIDPGAPLAAAKTVTADSVSDGQGAAAIGGYSLLEASHLAGAASW